MEVEAGAWGCVCAAVDGARLLVVCMMGRLSLPLSPFRHAQWRAVPIPTEPTELQAELKAMGIEPCGRARREGRKPLMAIEREKKRRKREMKINVAKATNVHMPELFGAAAAPAGAAGASGGRPA